jgi:hypothetical protein
MRDRVKMFPQAAITPFFFKMYDAATSATPDIPELPPRLSLIVPMPTKLAPPIAAPPEPVAAPGDEEADAGWVTAPSNPATASQDGTPGE